MLGVAGQFFNVDFAPMAKANPADIEHEVIGFSTATNGTSCTFRVRWNATGSHFIFGTNNTESWVNETAQSCSGTWTNATKTLHSNVDVVVQWQLWLNDTNGDWTNIPIQNLTTVSVYSAGAVTGSASDIQTAVNTVDTNGGGDIYVPWGNFSWGIGDTVTYTGSNDINIIGDSRAGCKGHEDNWENYTATTILHSNDAPPMSNRMFYFGGQGHNPLVYGSVKVSNIQFEATPPANYTEEDAGQGAHSAVYIQQIPDFRVSYCTFIDFCEKAVQLTANDGYHEDANISCYGVVDHCYMTLPYKTTDPVVGSPPEWFWGYGVQVNGESYAFTDDSPWWDSTATDFWGKYGYRRWFTMAYIEDCHFEYMRHCITTGGRGYFVSRFNLLDKPACGYTASALDQHGALSYGGRGGAYYNNTIIGASENKQPWSPYDDYWSLAFGLRGGHNLVYDNTFTCDTNSANNYFIILQNDEREGYEYMYLNHTYIWDNSYTNCSFLQNNDPATIHEDLEYFLREPTQEADGFTYTSYFYPHPLTLEDCPPQYSEPSVNTTKAGEVAEFKCKWGTPRKLSHGIFSYNTTGSWTNKTAISLESKYYFYFSDPLTLPSQVATTVQYKFYANDTTSEWNTTSTLSFYTTGSSSYYFVGTNNTLAGNTTKFHTLWQNAEGLSGFIFGTNNTGTWQNETWTLWTGTPTMGWSNYTDTLNSTVGVRVEFTFWCNDTNDEWASIGTRFLTTSSENITIEVDEISVSVIRVDIGTNVTIQFHSRFNNNQSSCTSGTLYVNSTGYSIDGTGWVTMYSLSATVTRKVYTVTGANVSGETDYQQIPPDPEITWDRLEVFGNGVSDNRADVSSSVIFWWKLQYDYDEVVFDSTKGSVEIGGSPASWNASGERWQRLVTLPSTAQNYSQTVTFTDSTYELTTITGTTSQSVIADKLYVVFSASESSPHIDEIVTISWTITRQYDSSSVTSFTINVSRNGNPWKPGLTNSSITDVRNDSGTYTYDVSYVSDPTYGLSSFASSASAVSWGLNPTNPPVIFSNIFANVFLSIGLMSLGGIIAVASFIILIIRRALTLEIAIFLIITLLTITVCAIIAVAITSGLSGVFT